MKKGASIAALVAVLALAGGAAGYVFFGSSPVQTSDRTVFRSISPQEARQLLESRQDLLLVDTRSAEEFRGGTIPGAALIPFWDFTKGRHALPKDKPILLFCAVGGRSFAAGRILAEQGYREVYNLEGGIQAWAAERLPIAQR